VENKSHAILRFPPEATTEFRAEMLPTNTSRLSLNWRAVAANTNWSGSSGGIKYTGGLGIHTTEIILFQAASGTPSVAGAVVRADPNNTLQAYLTIEVKPVFVKGGLPGCP
jgi:hypothetical protein